MGRKAHRREISGSSRTERTRRRLHPRRSKAGRGGAKGRRPTKSRRWERADRTATKAGLSRSRSTSMSSRPMREGSPSASGIGGEPTEIEGPDSTSTSLSPCARRGSNSQQKSERAEDDSKYDKARTSGKISGRNGVMPPGITNGRHVNIMLTMPAVRSVRPKIEGLSMPHQESTC